MRVQTRRLAPVDTVVASWRPTGDGVVTVRQAASFKNCSFQDNRVTLAQGVITVLRRAAKVRALALLVHHARHPRGDGW